MLKNIKKDIVDAAKLAGALYAGFAVAYTTVKLLDLILGLIF